MPSVIISGIIKKEAHNSSFEDLFKSHLSSFMGLKQGNITIDYVLVDDPSLCHGTVKAHICSKRYYSYDTMRGDILMDLLNPILKEHFKNETVPGRDLWECFLLPCHSKGIR